MRKLLLTLVLLSLVNITLAADNCTKEFNPVCDTEGNMYANECVLKWEWATLDSTYKYIDNKCVKYEIVCTKEFNPVCSTKWELFGNKCELEAKWAILDDAYEVIDNQCVKAEGVCTKEYAPVCWVDWKVYDNKCLAKADWVELDASKYVDSNRECANVESLDIAIADWVNKPYYPLKGERKMISFNWTEVKKSIIVKFDKTSMNTVICNSMWGEYSLDWNQISAPAMFRTEMYCIDEDLMAIEDKFNLEWATVSFWKLWDTKTLTIETAKWDLYEFDELTEVDQISDMFNQYFEKHSNQYTTIKDKKEFIEKLYSKLEKKSQNVRKKYIEWYKRLLDLVSKYKETM